MNDILKLFPNPYYLNFTWKIYPFFYSKNLNSRCPQFAFDGNTSRYKYFENDLTVIHDPINLVGEFIPDDDEFIYDKAEEILSYIQKRRRHKNEFFYLAGWGTKSPFEYSDFVSDYDIKMLYTLIRLPPEEQMLFKLRFC